MIEQKKAYKELVIRRDILKFILDLRIYNSITPSENINKNYYERYISETGNLTSRLTKFIDLFNQGLVNFAVLDAYDDDLHSRIDELLREYTDSEDKKKIIALEHEMFYIKSSCPNISTLPLELLKASHTGIQKEEYENILVEILKRTPFNTESKEYQFLMEHPEYTSFFIAYFQGKTPKEKVQEIYREICKKFTRLIAARFREENYSQEILNMLAREGAVVDATLIDSLIELEKVHYDIDLNALYRISRMIYNSHAKREVDCETYISSKLGGFDNMQEIASELPKITEVLVQLCYSDELLSTLAKIICAGENSIEIADLISKTFYSRYASPEIGEKFSECFLKAQERHEAGTSLVLTLKAVKDAKEKEKNK